MKSILLSIKPKYVSMILNKNKTIEVRKVFPKDYKGWVYIYCTKEKPYLFESSFETGDSRCECPISYLDKATQHIKSKSYYGKEYLGCPFVLHGTKYGNVLERRTYKNGKVVARFYCDKVEDIVPVISPSDNEIAFFEIESKIDLSVKSCLKEYDIEEYLCPDYCGDRPLEYFNKVVGYAIHISQLEIFDKPRYLYSFYKVGSSEYKNEYDSKKFRQLFAINKAPQSYQWIEVEK